VLSNEKKKKKNKRRRRRLCILLVRSWKLKLKEEKKRMDSQQNSTTAAVWMYRADGWPSIRLYTCSTRSGTASLSNPPSCRIIVSSQLVEYIHFVHIHYTAVYTKRENKTWELRPQSAASSFFFFFLNTIHGPFCLLKWKIPKCQRVTI
jgi:hypothetical protein